MVVAEQPEIGEQDRKEQCRLPHDDGHDRHGDCQETENEEQVEPLRIEPTPFGQWFDVTAIFVRSNGIDTTREFS